MPIDPYFLRRPAFEAMPDGSDYAHLVPRDDLTAVPFSSGLVRVPPGVQTWRHCHQDTEVFVVLSGHARMEWDREAREIAAGDVIVLPPFTEHTFINLHCETVKDLTFLTFWWTHRAAYEQAAKLRNDRPQEENAGLVHLVVALSGSPMASAEIMMRALEQRRTPAEMLAVDPAKQADHDVRVSDVCDALLERGIFELDEAITLCDPATEETLVETSVLGRCPVCGGATFGTTCHGCGAFIPEERILEARSANTGSLLVRGPTKRRLILRLERYRDLVVRAADSFAMTHVVQRRLASILAGRLPDVPMTHHAAWGAITDYGRAYRWLETAVQLLSSIETVQRQYSPARVRPLFHFDAHQTFFQTALMPVLFQQVGKNVPLPYVLHGIEPAPHANVDAAPRSEWVDDLPRVQDALGNEFLRGTIAGDDLRRMVEGWKQWFDALVRRIEVHAGGVTPEAGHWSARHHAVYAELPALAVRAARALEPDTFSVATCLVALDDIVAVARRLTVEAPILSGTETFEAEGRTTLALELAAARALGILAAPVLPALSTCLEAALGLATLPSQGRFARTRVDEAVQLVPPGLRLDASAPVERGTCKR